MAGAIEQVGTPLELYEQPANLFVAGFIGSPAMNFLKGRVAAVERDQAQVQTSIGARLAIPLSEPIEVGAEVTVGIRPEHIWLASHGDPGTHTGKAFIVEMLGSDTFIHLREGEENIVIRDSRARQLRMGDPVTISMPSSACYLFGKDGRRLSASHERSRPAEVSGRVQ